MNKVVGINVWLNTMAYGNENEQHKPIVNVEFEYSFSLNTRVELILFIAICKSVAAKNHEERNGIACIGDITY